MVWIREESLCFELNGYISMQKVDHLFYSKNMLMFANLHKIHLKLMPLVLQAFSHNLSL